MKQYLILFLGVLALGFCSCKKEKDETLLKQHDISSVAGPVTGTVNTALTLTITYPYMNGCDYIGSFEESKSGNTVTVKAYAKPVDKDAVCTQDAGSRTIEYKFTPATAGTFNLKFMKLNGTSVDHTVTVQ